ncbi:hypothetical protein AB0B45_40985 [Nonomuraea sp. NPDC049152]|uniref:hypothetical protein n=1 Tax=Nonomuraea sp. NPDC049152 TaxID=3154350 RepID=UPI0034010929
MHAIDAVGIYRPEALHPQYASQLDLPDEFRRHRRSGPLDEDAAGLGGAFFGLYSQGRATRPFGWPSPAHPGVRFLK